MTRNQNDWEMKFASLFHVSLPNLHLEQMEEEQKEALYAYASYWQALTDCNRAVLDEMIADDVTFTHMSGRVQTKEEYLQDVEDGCLQYKKVTIQNAVVHVQEERACVTCTTILKACAYGMNGSWPFTGSHSFQKKMGKWIVIQA